jgi:hypothetical protein
MGEGPSSPPDRVAALTCFVIGPIGNRHAPAGSDERLAYEEALEVYAEVIERACAEVNLQPVRADGLSVAGEIPEQVFRRLRDDDVVIADLTGANANVMYELGLRHTLDKLTLQVGEYGRLPFDVSVIRTVMFSRSPNGLIAARKELAELLVAGLEGQYDAVSATRIWKEFGPLVEETEPPDETPRPDDEQELEGPKGFVEILADAEESQEVMVEATALVAGAVEKMGGLAEEAAAKMDRSDAQGRGMKGRLAIAVEYADGLKKIADELERDVETFVEAMDAVSKGNLILIQGLEEDPAQLDQGSGRDFALSVRRMAQTVRETSGSLSGLVEIIAENAKAARVLREPSRRVAEALQRFSKATASVDEWDRRLQALGVPIPPEDWEPEEEGLSENGGGPSLP